MKYIPERNQYNLEHLEKILDRDLKDEENDGQNLSDQEIDKLNNYYKKDTVLLTHKFNENLNNNITGIRLYTTCPHMIKLTYCMKWLKALYFSWGWYEYAVKYNFVKNSKLDLAGFFKWRWRLHLESNITVHYKHWHYVEAKELYSLDPTCIARLNSVINAEIDTNLVVPYHQKNIEFVEKTLNCRYDSPEILSRLLEYLEVMARLELAIVSV